MVGPGDGPCSRRTMRPWSRPGGGGARKLDRSRSHPSADRDGLLCRHCLHVCCGLTRHSRSIFRTERRGHNLGQRFDLIVGLTRLAKSAYWLTLRPALHRLSQSARALLLGVFELRLCLAAPQNSVGCHSVPCLGEINRSRRSSRFSITVTYG